MAAKRHSYAISTTQLLAPARVLERLLASDTVNADLLRVRREKTEGQWTSALSLAQFSRGC